MTLNIQEKLAIQRPLLPVPNRADKQQVNPLVYLSSKVKNISVKHRMCPDEIIRINVSKHTSAANVI